MAKGVVTNPDLNMASPLIRLQGKGNVNLLSEAIDYALKTSVVGSLEGQGSAEKDELYGLEIPFAISGTISEPKFALDTAALFDAKLKKEGLEHRGFQKNGAEGCRSISDCLNPVTAESNDSVSELDDGDQSSDLGHLFKRPIEHLL